MPKVTIDGHEIKLPERQRLNVIQAAARGRHRDSALLLAPGADGRGQLPHVPGRGRHERPEDRQDRDAAEARRRPATRWRPTARSIVTNSEKVARARAMVEEDLLLRHPIDCPICDKAGECRLQDYHFEHGQDERRADIRPFTSRRRDIGDVTLFVDRCIMCSRCVRFTQEISGTNELMVVGRGAEQEIDSLPGFPLHNKLSGNVVDLCPVGALGDKDFLYRQRVWFLRQHKSVCTRCATGCSIWVEENQDQHLPHQAARESARQPVVDLQRGPLRLSARARPAAADGAAKRRGATVKRRRSTGGDSCWTRCPRGCGQARPAGAVLSPFLSVEEAYLLCKFMRA